ncbi:MAG: hypothetical protein ACTHMM_04855 [Agriterribacter sp.]
MKKNNNFGMKMLENEMKRKLIDEKLANKESLTVEECWMLGDQLQLDYLPQHAQCSDMYYRRLYLHYTEGGTTPLIPPLSKLHVENFKSQIIEWYDLMEKPHPKGSLLEAAQKETRQELKGLLDKWAGNPNISEMEKDEDVSELYAWSKFRYVLVRRIFDLEIKDQSFVLSLNGNRILFDYESAMHILTRHFAHGRKPYSSSKDHFYGVFRHDKLYLDFEKIFHAIDATKVYTNDPIEDINFRFKGDIYKICCRPIGKGETAYRIVTFFPVSSTKNLEILKDTYNEHQISEELSIFVRKKK